MTTPSRSTGRPCPCGSGLTGMRNVTLESYGYVACPRCYVQPAQKTYREIRDDDAKRQAAARRAIEARRDAAFAAGEGEVW